MLFPFTHPEYRAEEFREESLDSRVPRCITRIYRVSVNQSECRLSVETEQGKERFTIARVLDQVRVYGPEGTCVVFDCGTTRYVVPDIGQLDARSRRYLTSLL